MYGKCIIGATVVPESVKVGAAPQTNGNKPLLCSEATTELGSTPVSRCCVVKLQQNRAPPQSPDHHYRANVRPSCAI